MINNKETYISIDVETTGPCPGLYSMIDLGACAVGDLNNTFSASLLELPTAGRHAQTMAWWLQGDHKRRVLSQIQERAQDPSTVMWAFRDWLRQFQNPVLIGFPIAFDFAFVHYYWWKFIGSDPSFGHRGVDGKTIAMIILGSSYKKASKELMHKKIPNGFRSDLPHTHFAVDDAREQALLFEELMKLIPTGGCKNIYE